MTQRVHAEARDAVCVGGRYELLEMLGAGGAAEVWRGLDRRLDRPVAVKRLHRMEDRQLAARLRREARALAAISHPNVVQVYDYGASDGTAEARPYIVMELVDGSDLHAAIRREGAFEAHRAVSLVVGVLEGAACAHDAGMIHGDLKPANVLLADEEPKVGDFGVARVLEEETGRTTLAATPAYAAPEVLEGARPTEASDVYSVGCMLFHMLTGDPPFAGSMWEVIRQHREAPIPEIEAPVPDGLVRVLTRALAKDSRARYPTAREFAAELEPTLDAATLRLSSGAATTSVNPTQRLHAGVDPRAVALLGPLAPAADRAWGAVRSRLTAGAKGLGSARLWVGLVLAALTLIGMLTVSASGGASAVVPEVRGQTVREAIATFGEDGIEVDEVSYRPIADGEPGLVLRTIPAVGEEIEDGMPVHMIAGALVEQGRGEAAVGERDEAKDQAKGEAKGEKEADEKEEDEHQGEEGGGRGNGREGHGKGRSDD